MKKLILIALGMLIATSGISRDFTYEYEGQTVIYTVLDEDAKTCTTKVGEIAVPGQNINGELIIPEKAKDGDTEYTVIAIGDRSFRESNITSVTIPNSVTAIGEDAFYYTRSLKSVIIPSSVLTIDESAFELSNLESVTIGSEDVYETFQKIGESAFWHCSNLSTVIIGNSVQTIGKEAFSGCSELTSLTLGNSIQEIGEGAFSDCNNLASLTLGNTIHEIGEGAFEKCVSLTSVTIPESVETFGKYIFHDCTGLESVKIDSSTIGYGAFEGCTMLSNIDANDSLRVIGGCAFRGCTNIEQFRFPESLDTIQGGAFSDCVNLKSVTFPDRLKAIYISAFMNCTSLTSVVIPNSVEIVCGFNDCRNLESVTLGSSVRTIGWGSFLNCVKLKEVVLPPAVEEIGELAFANRPSIDESLSWDIDKVIMGSNVKKIESSAFDVDRLPEYYITAQTPPDMDKWALGDVEHSDLYLQGRSTISAYKKYYKDWECGREEPWPDDWSNFENYFKMIEPTDMEINTEEIEGNAGDMFQLEAKLVPEYVSLPYIFWRSTNPDVATVDHNGFVTIHRGPADVDPEEEGGLQYSCNIIAETLYYEGPAHEVKVNGGESAVESIISDSKKDNGNGKIDFNAPVEVYNMQGMLLGRDVRNLPSGLYIIRQGKLAKKLAI